MAYTPITISDEQKKALDEEHDDVLVLKGGERAPWLAVVRRPKRGENKLFKAQAKHDAAAAQEAFIRRLIVFPTGADLEQQLDRWSFIPDAIAESQSFKEFVGLSASEDLKA